MVSTDFILYRITDQRMIDSAWHNEWARQRVYERQAKLKIRMTTDNNLIGLDPRRRVPTVYDHLKKKQAS